LVFNEKKKKRTAASDKGLFSYAQKSGSAKEEGKKKDWQRRGGEPALFANSTFHYAYNRTHFAAVTGERRGGEKKKEL